MIHVRITTGMMVDRLMDNIQRAQQNISRFQDQMASGRSILKPHDDPIGTATVMRMRSGLKEIDWFRKSSEDAMGWISYGEGALMRCLDLTHELRELMIQGSTDSIPAESREAIAQEILVIRDHISDLANSKYDGRYIFAGHRTTEKPFEVLPDGSVIYDGDQGEQVRVVGPDLKIAVNLPGDQVFRSLMEMVHLTAQNISDGDYDLVGNDRLGELEDEIENLLEHVATLGARHSRVELSLNRVKEMEISFTSLYSQTADADLARVSIDLHMSETIYQAALSATARVLQPGLYEILR